MDQVNKGGRPPHVPTDEQRKKVAALKGGGMSNEAISMAIGIARQTLENNYAVELSLGAAEVRAEVILAILESAKKGSVAAAKMYLQYAGEFQAPKDDEPEKAAEPEVKPVKLGKKEQANADAATAAAGTEWEALLPTHRVQ